MESHGLADSIRVVPGGQAQLDGQRAARSCSSEGDLPTALIAYNDDTAVAAMGVLAQQGIDVPGQLSIIGWDDSEAAALSPVGLTSVVQQPAELARLAVERIVDRIDRRRVEDREIVLEPELRVRDEHRPAVLVECLDNLDGERRSVLGTQLDRSSDAESQTTRKGHP